MSTAVDNFPLIAAPQVLPFQERPRCPKCGNQESRKPMWLQRLIGARWSHITTCYCQGGKEPTKMVNMPLHNHKVEIMFLCAGISQEHMHRTCQNCNFHWLTEIKEKE